MPLFDDYARSFALMRRRDDPDGEGGRVTEWVEGEDIVLYLAAKSQSKERRAEREGPRDTISAYVDRSVSIGYGDYIRDRETGDTFRVTTDPNMRQAPASSSLPFKHFTAERRELPI